MSVPRKNDKAKGKDKDKDKEKDKIVIKNVANGQSYKFACRTCIDGHRAPLCDPVKHRGKVMFRRPAPGRPARNCGHAEMSLCDCNARRFLCCHLTDEEWDQIIRGEVPEVHMFQSQQELDHHNADAARRQAFEEAQAQAEAQFNASYIPSLPIRQQPPPPLMMANHPMPSGYANDMLPVYQSGQLAHFNQFQPARETPPPAMSQAMSNSLPPAPWNPRPELQNLHFNGPFNGSFLTPNNVVIGAHTEFMPVSARQFMSMAGDSPTALPPTPQSFTSFPPTLQYTYSAQAAPAPTQNCGSAQPSLDPSAQAQAPWNMPALNPRGQFPCSSCASRDCTCNMCPQLGQGPTGAWQNACNREHFFNPAMLGTGASFTPSQASSTTPSGCCSSRGPTVNNDVPPDTKLEFPGRIQQSEESFQDELLAHESRSSSFQADPFQDHSMTPEDFPQQQQQLYDNALFSPPFPDHINPNVLQWPSQMLPPPPPQNPEDQS